MTNNRFLVPLVVALALVAAIFWWADRKFDTTPETIASASL